MYTYLVGWSTADRYYYGVRMSYEGRPEDDLWKCYKTSSQLVAAWHTIAGEPDVIQVRRVFKTEAAARRCETRVHKKLKVWDPKNKKWLNGKSHPELIRAAKLLRKMGKG